MSPTGSVRAPRRAWVPFCVAKPGRKMFSACSAFRKPRARKKQNREAKRSRQEGREREREREREPPNRSGSGGHHSRSDVLHVGGLQKLARSDVFGDSVTIDVGLHQSSHAGWGGRGGEGRGGEGRGGEGEGAITWKVQC